MHRHLACCQTCFLPLTLVYLLTSKELGLQVHGIEGVSDLIVVRLDLACKAKVSALDSRRL